MYFWRWIFGYGTQAPFDRIIISLQQKIFHKITEQLKYGGIMVLPVGFSKENKPYKSKKRFRSTHYEEIFKVRFVPLVEGSQNI